MLSMDGNLHDGHRQRLIDKFVSSPNGLANHELLEILLFSVMPRKDTNELAHKLLLTFGSFKRIFSATPEELMGVRGVGPRIASHIATFGKLLNETALRVNQKPMTFVSFHKNRQEVIDLFINPQVEKFFVVLLDAKCREITRVEFESYSENMVRINPSVLAKAIAINTPVNAVIAHNHPSGDVRPSRDDDLATTQIFMICKLHGVNLMDHVIVGRNNNAYSYFIDGKLDKIEHSVKSDDISKKI